MSAAFRGNRSMKANASSPPRTGLLSLRRLGSHALAVRIAFGRSAAFARPPSDAAALLGHRVKPPLRDPDVFARVPVKSFRYNARRESKWGGQPRT